MTVTTTIQIRRDTVANWTSANPVLHQGEAGLETDTGKAKAGDGVTAWTSLAYWDPAAALLAVAAEAARAETAEAALMPRPSGTPGPGQVPAATGTGEASAWSYGGGLTGQYADQAPAQEYSLTGTTGITGLLAAIANRNNTRADIAFIGDSITEGQGATTWASGLVQQANRAIRNAYPTSANGTTGGQGFIPIMSTGESSYTWPVTSVGSAAAPINFGPVQWAAELEGTQSFTWTAPAGTTSVQIMYFDGTSGGQWSYKVGAGSTTTITTVQSLHEKLTASIPITSGQVLTIAWVSGTGNQGPTIDGIVHFAGDETSGVTFHECGHYGWDTSTSEWNQPGYFGLNWAQCYANGFPNISGFVIFLGGNDATRVNAATFQVNLTNFIGTLRGAATVLNNLPIILIVQYTSNHTWVDPGGWPAYMAVYRSIAAALPNVSVVDLNYRMPSSASSFGSEIYADGIHPTNFGHALIGEIVAAGVRIA